LALGVVRSNITSVLVALLFRLFGCFAYINLCFLVMLLAFLLSVEVIDSEYHLWNELYVGRGYKLGSVNDWLWLKFIFVML